MDADRFSKIKRILSSALELPEAERKTYLKHECGTDTDLLRNVESLLDHDHNAHVLFKKGRWVEVDISDELVGAMVSHYRILNRIGEGGMGIVYAAEDVNLRRRVALKFLPTSMMREDSAKDRFIHEARAAAVLDHPNICTVYEIGDISGFLFIAMAYIEGETLAHILAKDTLPMHHCVELAIQIASGLQAAHSRGVIHRDIKPGNIMVTPAGLVKIMDFGLSKTVGFHDTTVPGKVMGTAAYMSPEQAAGERVDHRTDLWSLGVVLYEMISGRRPFDAERQQIIIHRILETEPPRMTDIKPEVPEELERIVYCALTKSLNKRYQYAADIHRELSTFQRTLDLTCMNVESSGPRSTGIPISHKESTVSWMQRTARQTSCKSRGFEVYSLSNLPAPLRGFIGRKDELEETKRLIKNNRLVTICGTEGVGKSRLAIQSATELVEIFPDGTYFVSLSVILSGETFWRSLCDALDIHLSGPESEKQQLLGYIENKAFLLILDNFEPDIHHIEWVEIILHHSAGAKIIVTTRDPLNHPSESVLNLEGMYYPDIRDSDNPWASDAIRLFMQAARITNPALDLQQANMNALIYTAHFLRGIPLALELVATWSCSMTIEKIPGMIKKQIGHRWWKKMRTPGIDTVVPAVLRKTWDLMPGELRDIVLRISIFRSGFRKNSAGSLVANGEEYLEELVRRSFLRKSRSGKYEMPGIIREFSRSRLQDRRSIFSEVIHTNSRHFTEILISARESFLSSRYKETLMLIADNIQDIRHIFYISIKDHRTESLEKCLPGLAAFYDLKHWYGEAEKCFSDAFNEYTQYFSHRNEEKRHELFVALLRGERGVFMGRLGGAEDAIALLSESIEFLRNADASSYLPYFLMNVGQLQEQMGSNDEAYTSLQESLPLLRDGHAPIGLGYVNITLARISRARGDAPAARHYMEEFDRLADEARERPALSWAARCLGELRDVVELESEWFPRARSILAILR